MPERELTAPVSLTQPDGRLNTDAVGYAREPLVDTSAIGREGSWGRNKRWEYWNVMTPHHIVSMAVAALDYAAVHEVWVLERESGREWRQTARVIPARDVELPRSFDDAPAVARAENLAVTVTPWVDGRSWRLYAEIPDASFDLTVTRPRPHDFLAVVVPWSMRRFQYTVKAVALPVLGTIVVEGRPHAVPEGVSWATLDHGRGRLPYDTRWNWGAAAGAAAGHVIGLQLGGRATAGTGSTENGVFVDGRLRKISEELVWRYDLGSRSAQWRVSGGGLDATFTPAYVKSAHVNYGIVASASDQLFGTWEGEFDGIRFSGLDGFAEETHRRW
ncbi:DUF2804 domain-containing protein [Microbacterium sp.]|uniref:DUF2804 domain-containing protein n=1 Tax=Microbacterium sp. TaxID=51671 RepID=UPI003A89CA33